MSYTYHRQQGLPGFWETPRTPPRHPLAAARNHKARTTGIPLAALLSALTIAPALAAAADMPAAALGTADQVRLEALAIRVLATPEAAEARRQVQELFRGDPVAATDAGRSTLDEAVEETLFAAIVDTVADDPLHPAFVWTLNAPHQWFEMKVPGARYGIDNPDNIYRLAFLDGASHYEIKGRRHASGPAQVSFELLDSAPGLPGIGKQIALLKDTQIVTGADGAFTITIDPDPANGRPNHIQSSPAAKALLVRDTLSDWNHEIPNELEIRRLGPVEGDHPSVHQLALQAAGNAPAFAAFWLGFRDHALSKSFGGKVNRPGKVSPREGGWGFAASGQFRLAPDDALVVTLAPLGASYVGFQLTDPWAISADYIDRQGSLNNHQAVANPDGSLTYVVSERDPGIANWLDPSGLSEGFFQLRWQQVPPGTDADGAVREVKLVKLTDLPRALPPGTRTVSPAERREQLEERHAAYGHRLEN